MSTPHDHALKTANLPLLHRHEAQLAASIAAEKEIMLTASANLARLAEEMSVLKKAIGPLALRIGQQMGTLTPHPCPLPIAPRRGEGVEI